jgi:hypothetical protein
MEFTPEPHKGQLGMIKRLEVRNVTKHPVWADAEYLEGTKAGGNCHLTATHLGPQNRDRTTPRGVLLNGGESMTVGLIASEDTALEDYRSELHYGWVPATESVVIKLYERIRSHGPDTLARHVPELMKHHTATCPVKVPQH